MCFIWTYPLLRTGDKEVLEAQTLCAPRTQTLIDSETMLPFRSHPLKRIIKRQSGEKTVPSLEQEEAIQLSFISGAAHCLVEPLWPVHLPSFLFAK